jgi:hypothetical protein
LILSVQGNTVKRKNCSFLKKRTKKLLLRRGHDLVLKQDRLERRPTDKRFFVPFFKKEHCFHRAPRNLQSVLPSWQERNVRQPGLAASRR